MTDQRLILIGLFILSVIALIGGMLLSLEAAFTLAATGVGAFAGAVNSLWGGEEEVTSEEE